jgi:heat-inducible transcriptional repressor
MAMTRQDQILKLIVEEFIATATPVGSKTLMEKYHLDYSSATIRNDMMELEEEGLIEKTHASSGRVPSAKGYKYYVEHLQAEGGADVDSQFKKEFQLILAKKSQSIEDVMNQSCQILSDMTNMATVVLGGDAQAEHLISVSVVPISDKAATAIFVTDKGYVQNKTFVIHNEKEAKDIMKCVEVLNKRLTGTSLDQLGNKIEALKPILTSVLGKSSDLIMEAFVEAFVKFAKDRLYTTGAQKLLELPEYGEDKKKLQNVLDLLNDPDKLEEFMESESEDDGTGICFSKSPDDDVAVVTQDFKINGLPSTTKVAVVGPQRMNYKKIIATLGYISQEINKYFAADDSQGAETSKGEKKETGKPDIGSEKKGAK